MAKVTKKISKVAKSSKAVSVPVASKSQLIKKIQKRTGELVPFDI